MAGGETLTRNALDVLESRFGFDSFRPGQEPVFEAYRGLLRKVPGHELHGEAW